MAYGTFRATMTRDSSPYSVLPNRKLAAIDDETVFEQTTEERRQIGVVSAIFLIFNRMVGTGIFATPGSILALSGSVGLSLWMWVAGTLISACGMMVYLEFGVALPKNGGEKNYLEFVYRSPKFLATASFASYVFLLGWAGSNSIVFGEYILHAADVEVGRWNQRGVGLGCVTVAFLVHGIALNWGLRLQNFLGMIKLLVILLIVVSGWAALGGAVRIEKPRNFHNAFEGTTASSYGIVMALYNVMWSFVGYSNANYALSETRNPARTLKIAAPVALVSVGVLYMLTNIAYLAAVPKEDMMDSGRMAAAEFFKNVFGPRASKALSVFVALSAFGNVLSVIFSQGRIVQELAREGILPFSSFFASNEPFNAPLAGLFEHWVVSVIIMLAPPPGDAFSFVMNVITYPLSVVNFFVATGLLYIYFNRKQFDWNPKIRATLPVVVVFLLANVFLIVAPFVPPETPDQNVYEHLPYYLHCVVGIGILAAGGVYWAFWAVLLPRIGGYKLVRETVLQQDGWSRNVFLKRYG